MWNTPIGETVVCGDLIPAKGGRRKFEAGRLCLRHVDDPRIWMTSISFGADAVEFRNDLDGMLDHFRRWRQTLIAIGFQKSAIDELLVQIPEYRARFGAS